MRQILFIGLIFLIISSCNESKEQIEIIEEIQNIPGLLILASDDGVVKKHNGDIFFKGMPFSGYLLERYANDSISLKIGYYKGKQNGVMTGYYRDGSIRFQRPYLDGEKHGTHIGYHKNGVKAFEYYFENGFNEGNHKEWFEDGTLAADMNYVGGKEFGKQQVWRSDGKIRSNYIVRENGRRYGLMGIKRCTKLDGATKTVDPYKGIER